MSCICSRLCVKADAATMMFLQLNELRTLLAADGRTRADESYVLARYNDPSTRPRFRRNEVLIPLENFSLW